MKIKMILLFSLGLIMVSFGAAQAQFQDDFTTSFSSMEELNSNFQNLDQLEGGGAG